MKQSIDRYLQYIQCTLWLYYFSLFSQSSNNGNINFKIEVITDAYNLLLKEGILITQFDRDSYYQMWTSEVFYFLIYIDRRSIGIAKKFKFLILMEIDVLKLKNIKYIGIRMPSVCPCVCVSVCLVCA